MIYGSFSLYSSILHTHFLTLERKFLLYIAILVRCFKIFLNQSHIFGKEVWKKVFSEISLPYIGIQSQGFILQSTIIYSKLLLLFRKCLESLMSLLEPNQELLHSLRWSSSWLYLTDPSRQLFLQRGQSEMVVWD